jgi:hypothetical protein
LSSRALKYLSRAIVVQPPIKVIRDERIIGKIGMLATDAIDLRRLTRAQPFVGIEAPDSFQQALAAKDLVAASDAPSEVVHCIEKRTVAIGHATIECKEIGIDTTCRGRFFATFEDRNSSASPNRPMPEEAATKSYDNVLIRPLHHERCQQIEYDVIVIAGIKRDAFLCARRHNTADDIQGAVAVKRGDLDGDYIVDGREASPESTAKGDPTHSWLQIEAH